MKTRDEIEFRKAQTALLVSQMVKDGDLSAEAATEFVVSLKDFLGNGHSDDKS